MDARLQALPDDLSELSHKYSVGELSWNNVGDQEKFVDDILRVLCQHFIWLGNMTTGQYQYQEPEQKPDFSLERQRQASKYRSVAEKTLDWLEHKDPSEKSLPISLLEAEIKEIQNKMHIRKSTKSTGKLAYTDKDEASVFGNRIQIITKCIEYLKSKSTSED